MRDAYRLIERCALHRKMNNKLEMPHAYLFSRLFRLFLFTAGQTEPMPIHQFLLARDSAAGADA